MYALFNLILDICLFRKGPQDLPSSEPLMGLCLVTYGLSSLLVLMVNMGFLVALSQTGVDIALLAGLTYALLKALGHPMRYTQTLTALAGTGTLLGLIAWPLVVWMDRVMAREGDLTLPSLLFLGLVVWSIAVMAHVLRHALSASRGVGLLCALGYLIVSVTVAGWLFAQA